MKKLNSQIGFFVVLFMLCIIPIESQAQLFFDDFEQDISQSDAVFDHWTTENITGWHYWHIIPAGGIDWSQCMRFGNYDIYNEDWLITKQIVGSNITHVKLSFNHFHLATRNAPKLYYTNVYNGNADESDWTEISYTLGENEGEWYSTGDILIENPGNILYFGFHYDAAPEDAIYLLLDNFKVESYSPPPPMTLVGSSEHFEFYTNITGEENYYQSIESTLEKKYLNYVSIWQRPGSDPVFPDQSKIKIYYCSRASIPGFDSGTPTWDCGDLDLSNDIIYLAPFETTDQENYYGSKEALAANELSQMALQGWMDINVEYWYREGFGLYEMGFRPDRTNLLLKLSSLGTNEPEISTVNDIALLHYPGNKDLMASYFESKALLHCYYYNYYDYNSTRLWWQLLKHYYIKETDRIQLIYTTEHFDYYAATKEDPYVGPLAMNMEEQFDMQETRFNVKINHRINVCIYDNEVGKEINDRDDFQGLACGADKINTSHLEIDDYGLMNHEFMHMLVNFCSNHNPGPGQFLNEGLAESTDAFMSDEEMPWHRYKIQDLYYHYQRKYNREPTFLEIVDNAEVSVEDPFWVDAYALGEMYWRYMNDKYPSGFWENVKFFLASGRDWSVFGGKTTEQEGAEFIQFMKELAFVGPPLEARTLPFTEDFNSDFDGWTTMRFAANDQWRWTEDEGISASGCAKIFDAYWLEEKDVDSWLVSPPLNTQGIDSLTLSFAFKQHGQAIKPEIYYTDLFTGPTGSSEWHLLEDVEWGIEEGIWKDINRNIGCLGDSIFIALRFISVEGNSAFYLVDNLNVTRKGVASGFQDIYNTVNILKIFPNPLTETSLASFDVTAPGQVSLSVYNMQGLKLVTLFDKEVPAGNYTVPLNRLSLNRGIYLCCLQTPDGTSIVKFVLK